MSIGHNVLSTVKDNYISNAIDPDMMTLGQLANHRTVSITPRINQSIVNKKG